MVRQKKLVKNYHYESLNLHLYKNINLTVHYVF